MEITNSQESKVLLMLTNIFIYIWVVLSSAKEDNPREPRTRHNALSFPGWRDFYLQNARRQFRDGGYKYNDKHDNNNDNDNDNKLHSDVNNYQENCQEMLYYRGTPFSQSNTERPFLSVKTTQIFLTERHLGNCLQVSFFIFKQVDP